MEVRQALFAKLTFKASIFFLRSSASSLDSWLSEPSLSYWNTQQQHVREVKKLCRTQSEDCTLSPLSRALICCRSLKFCKRICLSLDKYSWGQIQKPVKTYLNRDVDTNGALIGSTYTGNFTCTFKLQPFSQGQNSTEHVTIRCSLHSKMDNKNTCNQNTGTQNMGHSSLLWGTAHNYQKRTRAMLWISGITGAK